MKSIVVARRTKPGKSSTFPIIASVKMTGDELSEQDQELWKSELAAYRKKNFDKFKEHLAKHTRK